MQNTGKRNWAHTSASPSPSPSPSWFLYLLLVLTFSTPNTIGARRSRLDLLPSPSPPPPLPLNNASSDNLATATSDELIQVPIQQPPSPPLPSPATATAGANGAAGIGIGIGVGENLKSEASVKHDQLSKSGAVGGSAASADFSNTGGAAAAAAITGAVGTKSAIDASEKHNAATAAVASVASSSASISSSGPSPAQPSETLKTAQTTTGDEQQLQKEQKQSLSGEDIDLDYNSSTSSHHNGHLPSVALAEPHVALEECDPDMVGFEIVTGYVFSAPDRLLDSLPGTLMLTDCLEACQSNETCHAVNYETGLCVLFSANADKLPGALTKSQFPVFTIYAQKSCLGVRPCARAWCIDRVHGYKLMGHAKRSMPVTSRRDCLELCLGEMEFTCRSANFDHETHTCELSEMDRITLAGTGAFQSHEGVDYLENNCAEEPNKLCEFKRLSGRILKTVDSVYQDIGSIDECRDLCLNSPYRCHSYDYGDTGDMVCRLSHHSRATLADVQDPYLDVPEAATYELSSCYNVTIECGAGDMIARIRTSKLFDGKLYAKGSPKSCAVDVKKSLEFELRMGYQDLECNVRQSGSGRYMNDVVIQHHDMIVTSSDLGLAVTCQYDLTNKSVSNDVDLDVKGDIEPALSEEVIVDSPNVIMKITSRDGSDIMRSAEVGDPLALKFEILDEHSPYEIFVRELVAMDGGDNAEITLIDSNGCPTDHFIMGPIYKSPLSAGKVLLSHFDAFKFPSSEVVQFRALVTPCMPSCEPVQCDNEDNGGEFKSLLSFGRRRRSVNVTATFTGSSIGIGGNQQHQRSRRDTTNKLGNKNHNSNNNNNNISSQQQEDMLLVQSIQITDKFGFDKQQQQTKSTSTTAYDGQDTVFITTDQASGQGFCVNAIGIIVATTGFLLAQLAVIAIWTYLYQRRNRKLSPYSTDGIGSSSSGSSSYGSRSVAATSTIISQVPNARSESMCKLYEGGFGGRHGRQF